MSNLVLYTCGSDLIVDYLEVCIKNSVTVNHIIHNIEKKDSSIESIDVEEYRTLNDMTPFLVPLFTPYNRFLAVQEALLYGMRPYTLLNDRNNDLPVHFSHGEGCFINKRVVIGSHSRIGNFVVINRGACLGHHLSLGDFVSIGPGVVTGGGVVIKRGALIGTGAVVIPEVTIGEHAIVGAGAVVTKDVAPYSVVLGNPAQEIKLCKNHF